MVIIQKRDTARRLEMRKFITKFMVKDNQWLSFMGGIVGSIDEVHQFINSRLFSASLFHYYSKYNLSKSNRHYLRLFGSLIIFVPVKKWLAHILSFYLLISAVIPCSLFDKCEGGEQKEQTNNKKPGKDCNGCSPFCVCSSSHNFTFNTMNPSVEPIKIAGPLIYSEYYLSCTSEYYSSLFQPPRVS